MNMTMKILFMLSALLSYTHSFSRTFVRGLKKQSNKMATQSERMYENFQKHPELFQDKFEVSWLHDDFVRISDAFQKADKDKDPDTIIPELLKKEMDGVYSFNVFNENFLKMFNEELENFYEVSEKEKIPVRR